MKNTEVLISKVTELAMDGTKQTTYRIFGQDTRTGVRTAMLVLTLPELEAYTTRLNELLDKEKKGGAR